MRTARFQSWIICALALGSAFIIQAAEEEPAPPPNRPDPAALRERAKKLSPEERQKMIREFRQKHGLGATNRADLQALREELKNLPPEERAAKLRELRRENQQEGRGFKLLAPAEREGKRREMKERIDAQIAELQKRKAEGSLTEQEQRRLERMQQMSTRLARGDAGNLKRPATLKTPPASEIDVLPPPKPAPNSTPEK